VHILSCGTDVKRDLSSRRYCSLASVHAFNIHCGRRTGHKGLFKWWRW